MRTDLFTGYTCKTCSNTDTAKFTRLSAFENGVIVCKCLKCDTMFILTFIEQEGVKND